MPTIRSLRIEHELSQVNLAQAAGVSTPVIARMEAGKRVSRESFRRVCTFFGVLPSAIEGVQVYVPVRDRQPSQKQNNG